MALSGADEPQATLERLRTQDAQTYEALFQNLGPELWDLAVAVGRRRAGAAPPTLTAEQVIGLVEQLILSGIPEIGRPVSPSALVDPMRRGVVERPGELPVILPSVLDEIWTAAETAWEALLSAAEGILGNPFEMVAGVIQLVQLAWTVAIANGTVPVSAATRAAAIEEVLQIIVALGPAARSVAAGLAGLEFLGATPQLTLRLRCRAMWEIILAVVTPEKAAAGVAQAAEEAASLARLVRALAVP
jgi:hypothetical protein